MTFRGVQSMLSMAQRCGNGGNGKEGRGGKERDGGRADDIPLDSTCVHL